MTYKGNDGYKSLAGGFVSTLIYIISLIMIGVLMKVVITKGNLSTSINQVVKDLTNNSESHYFSKNDISFAIKLIGPTPEKLLDSSYFYFDIFQLSMVKDKK